MSRLSSEVHNKNIGENSSTLNSGSAAAATAPSSATFIAPAPRTGQQKAAVSPNSKKRSATSQEVQDETTLAF